jgi:hypothetical protein
MKICSKCYKMKPLAEFNIRHESVDGRSYVCKSCHSIEQNSRYTRKRRKRVIDPDNNQIECYKCRKILPKDQFSITRNNKFHSYCKSCRNISRRTRDEWAKKRDARYGLLPGQYDRLLVKQNSVCAICKLPETCTTIAKSVSPLSVDHSHNTGVIRGLLCNNCNLMLGYAKDNIQTLKQAILYLEGNNEKNKSP